VGRQVGEIAELSQERILLLVRGGHELPLDTQLQAGDQIVMFTQRPAADFMLEEPVLLSPAAR
jgi:hypothetical protein